MFLVFKIYIETHLGSVSMEKQKIVEIMTHQMVYVKIASQDINLMNHLIAILSLLSVAHQILSNTSMKSKEENVKK